jgi:hypothetical protein
MSFRLLDAVSAVGVSRAVRLGSDIGVKDHTVELYIKSLGTTAISAVTVRLQGSYKNVDATTGVIDNSGIAVGSTNTRVTTATFNYRIKETNYTKTSVAAGAVFTAAHVIGNGADDLYGCINLYLTAAGLLVSQVPLSPQVYTTAALAHTAADAILNPLDTLCYIGRILIRANALTWTGNTSDLVAGSGVTAIAFLPASSTFRDMITYICSSDDITDGRAMFTLKGYPARFVRLYLSALTGTGTVTAYYTPEDSP